MFTDKPAEDEAFMLSQFPSLRATQDRLDSLVPQAKGALPPCTINERKHSIQLCVNITDINVRVNALRGLAAAAPGVARGAIGLDAEWPLIPRPQGGTTPGPVALIQLACVTDAHGSIQVVLLRVNGAQRLPATLLALFADPALRFVGRCVSADIAKIGRDFAGCSSRVMQLAQDRSIDLARLACERGVVDSARVGLADLVEVVLKERLDKPAGARCSDWAASALSREQQTYAALDAIKSLEVYVALAPLPDLTLRLSADAVRSGLKVEIGPGAGSMATLSARAARCIIEEAAEWASPRGCQPATMKPTQSRVLVRVTEVLAPGLIVPNVKGADGSSMTLGSFGPPPFLLIVPLKMLKPRQPAPAPTPAAAPARAVGSVLPAASSAAVAQPAAIEPVADGMLGAAIEPVASGMLGGSGAFGGASSFADLAARSARARAERRARAARAAHPPACWRPTRSESRPSPQAVIAPPLRARRDSRALRVLLPRAARARQWLRTSSAAPTRRRRRRRSSTMRSACSTTARC
jgi:hypothetical protein